MKSVFMAAAIICCSTLIAELCAAKQCSAESVRAESGRGEAPTPGSDASFDQRLPPALPGETVADSGGTMKLWSTAGRVSGGPPPDPSRKCGESEGAGCEKLAVDRLIVDARSDSFAAPKSGLPKLGAPGAPLTTEPKSPQGEVSTR